MYASVAGELRHLDTAIIPPSWTIQLFFIGVQLVGSTPFEVFDWDYIHCSDTGAKFFLLILLDENERAKLNICSSMRNLSRPRAGQTFIWLKTLGYQLQVL